MYVGSGLYWCYGNVATYESSSFYTQGEWGYASYGPYTDYQSIDSGYYYLVFDGDSDHSYIDAYSTNQEYFAPDKSYTCSVGHDGSSYYYNLYED